MRKLFIYYVYLKHYVKSDSWHEVTFCNTEYYIYVYIFKYYKVSCELYMISWSVLNTPDI
jgi:hypothetical protein